MNFFRNIGLVLILCLTFAGIATAQTVKPVAEGPFEAGEAYWIEIEVEEVENLYGFSTFLEAEGAETEYVSGSGEAGEFLSGDLLEVFEQPDARTVDMGVTQTEGEGTSGSGIVARARFVSHSGGEVHFSLSEVSANDSEDNDIPLEPEDLQVTIQEGDPEARPITFRVDMSFQEELNEFRPDDGDTVKLRGEMNDWGGDPIVMELTDDDIYETTVSLEGFEGETMEYKFAYTAGDGRELPNDGWEQIDNRELTLGPDEEPQELDTVFFNDEEPKETVEVASIDELLEVGKVGSDSLYTVTEEVYLVFNTTFRHQKVIVDETGGIVIDDPDGIIPVDFNRYDGLIGITGTLGEFNGLIQFRPVTGIEEPSSVDNSVQPEPVSSLAEIDSTRQGELIRIQEVTFQETGEFENNVNYTIEDEDDNELTMRTDRIEESIFDEGEESYIGMPIPDEPVTLVGYVGHFEEPLLIVRKAGDIQTEPPFTIHYNNPENWDEVYAYVWEEVEDEPVDVKEEWPGESMDSPEDGNIWYSYEIPGNFNRVIFNDGGEGEQTEDLVRTEDGWFDGRQWHDEEPDLILPDEEREALIALYEATDGDNWESNDGWKEGDEFTEPGTESTWHGISITGVHVTEVALLNNGLEGQLPEELQNLEELEVLRLGGNSLSGDFYGSIAGLESLHWLDLSRNEFSGGLPEELSSLTGLEALEIHGNPQLSGVIPESYTDLELAYFNYSETEVLTPASDSFIAWAENISELHVSGLVDMEAPEKVAPEPGNVGVAHMTLFGWNDHEYADQYEIRVHADSADGDVVFQKDNIVSTGIKAELDYHTDYYWQLRGALEEFGRGDWSEPNMFTTRLEDEIAPELEGPEHESDEVAIPVKLTWHEPDEKEASSYHIEVSHTPDFDTSFVVKGYEDTEAEIEEMVADTTTYFWRVRAEVDQQLTSWSSTWSFTTELRPPETPEWQPEDGDTDVDDLLVKWSEAERAETYNLQLAEDEDFDELVFDESGLEETEFELQEDQLDPNTTYHWRISAENESGDSGWSEALSFTTAETVTAEADQEIPDEFGLEANYPNPFNPDTQISYRLAEDAEVTLRVYDTLGREVTTLVNTHQSAGKYEVSFDASNLSSGTYIYRIEAGGFVESRQMMLVK